MRKTILVNNPFNAPVYHEEIVSSTMDVSKKLAENGEAHGTVIIADFQTKGRGRGNSRTWQMEKGINLPFTILLRFPGIEAIPTALTLRTGLAVSLAVEEFAPVLKNNVKLKWPNDVMISEQLAMNNEQLAVSNEQYKKAAGILCEASGEGIAHIGIGVNVGQKGFPLELQNKATSIALAIEKDIPPEGRFILLEMILKYLFEEFFTTNLTNDWKPRLEKRLFKIGEPITFIDGAADSGNEVKGILSGIGTDGALIIDGNAYTTGELIIN